MLFHRLVDRWLCGIINALGYLSATLDIATHEIIKYRQKRKVLGPICNLASLRAMLRSSSRLFQTFYVGYTHLPSLVTSNTKDRFFQASYQYGIVDNNIMLY